MKGGGGSSSTYLFEFHIPILKNDIFEDHFESFPVRLEFVRNVTDSDCVKYFWALVK